MTRLTTAGEKPHLGKPTVAEGQVVEIRRTLWQDTSLPFTLAHPAIVLPLRRMGLVFSALIVGSLVPDIPYFLQGSNEIRWGHTTTGVFWFCLPVGLALLWLFHSLVKRPLVSLAPEFIRQRVTERDLEFNFAPSSRFLLIILSLFIGTMSHVLWDGFTHDHGYFVKHWPLLSTPVETYRVMPLWRALQQGFSVLGVAIVGLVTVWWWYRKPVTTDAVCSEMTSRLRWFVVAIMTVLACLVGTAIGLSMYHGHGHGWKVSLIRGVVATISAASAEMLLYSVVWHLQRNSSRHIDEPVEELNLSGKR